MIVESACVGVVIQISRLELIHPMSPADLIYIHEVDLLFEMSDYEWQVVASKIVALTAAKRHERKVKRVTIGFVSVQVFEKEFEEFLLFQNKIK